MIRSALSLFLLFPAAWVQAQEHPYLSRFELIGQQGAVRLEWTMVAGNTCINTEIWRGTDPNALERIGVISGLCGSITSPVDYTYTDNVPPELSTLYYRLVLGIAGASSTQSIVFDQLVDSEIRIVAFPMDHGIDVHLAVPLNAEVDLNCWTMDGKLVYTASGLRGHRHHVPVPTNASGAMILQAISNGRSITGRFVLAK